MFKFNFNFESCPRHVRPPVRSTVYGVNVATF
jgi:hypothetical protein